MCDERKRSKTYYQDTIIECSSSTIRRKGSRKPSTNTPAWIMDWVKNNIRITLSTLRQIFSCWSGWSRGKDQEPICESWSKGRTWSFKTFTCRNSCKGKSSRAEEKSGFEEKSGRKK